MRRWNQTITTDDCEEVSKDYKNKYAEPLSTRFFKMTITLNEIKEVVTWNKNLWWLRGGREKYRNKYTAPLLIPFSLSSQPAPITNVDPDTATDPKPSLAYFVRDSRY